nr:MAG TPA: hypothetical protein [Caudoviricetes sp.]
MRLLRKFQIHILFLMQEIMRIFKSSIIWY